MKSRSARPISPSEAESRMEQWAETLEPERAHGRRVAAWAWIIARKQGLDGGAAALLDQAARIHHDPGVAWTGEGAARLLAEVNEASLAGAPPPGARADTSDMLAAALRHVCASAGPREAPVARLLRVLEAAHVFDECLEALPYERRSLGELLEEAAGLAPDKEWAALLDVFRKPFSFTDRRLEAALRKLSVNPRVVCEAGRVLPDPEAGVRDLERLAGLDPALAAALLQAANAALRAARQPVSTLAQAVVRLGLDESRRILTAAALRGAFRAPGSKRLWSHSLETAALASELAGQAPGLDPAEAFLAGLLHDLGRLLLLASPEPPLALYSELTARGCPPVAAELALCGEDHASIGARALARWGLAGSIVEAVRGHHQSWPEPNILACLLQLCEEMDGDGEDLPSLARFRDSLSALKLNMARLRGAAPRLSPGLMALRGEP